VRLSEKNSPTKKIAPRPESSWLSGFFTAPHPRGENGLEKEK